MPIEIDGFAVLGAIARRPDVFPAARPEAVKTAKAFVGKQLKDKGLTVEALRAVAEAVSFDSFDMIVDAISDAEVKALLVKVDKLNPDAKTASAQVQRKLVADLARGLVLPSQKLASVKAPKAVREAKPKVERADSSRAMRAKKKV